MKHDRENSLSRLHLEIVNKSAALLMMISIFTVEKLQTQTNLTHDTIEQMIFDHVNLRETVGRYILKQLTDAQGAEQV